VTAVHQPRPAWTAPNVSGLRLAGSRLWGSRFLNYEERCLLDAAVSSSRQVKANTRLLREGDHADSLLIVVDGWACREAITRQGDRQLPSLLVPGDVGNLDSMLFERLDYGVLTITPATIVTLPRERILTLSAEHPGIARSFT
jgi:CRP-like cAMP-binding protein